MAGIGRIAWLRAIITADGGWVKAAGVVAAGGAQAQRDVKRGMNSCDALLCDPVGA